MFELKESSIIVLCAKAYTEKTVLICPEWGNIYESAKMHVKTCIKFAQLLFSFSILL